MSELRITLAVYDGRWPPDDPDANFKREVAEYTRLDPLETLRGLASRTGIPVGALARYALVKWSAEGSEALLALGPRTVVRMKETIDEAEQAGTDAARLAAYDVLRAMVGWLAAPLAGPDVSPGADARPSP